MKPLKVAVLGAGSWGTALAALIARHGHQAMLWGRDAMVARAIDLAHENPRYLPGIGLPVNLRASTDLAATMAGADQVLVVVPSHAFTQTLHLLAPLLPAGVGLSWATKGFEPGTAGFCMKWPKRCWAAACRWPWSPGHRSPRKWPRACRPR